MSEVNNLKDVIQSSIDLGLTAAEDIHKTLAGAPFKMLEQIESLEDMASEAQELQGSLIGSVYEIIRNVNQTFGNFVSEFLAEIDAYLSEKTA
ncbi:hypothetical protein WDW89_16480 [Deltaproteobacteria bacterium TL4]